MYGRTRALLKLDWRGERESSAREGEDKGVAVHCERRRIDWFDILDRG
jgi:hypothetical protein